MPLNLPAAATPPIQQQNPYEQLRLQQIFGGTPPNQPTMGGMTPTMDMGGYQPETGAADRLDELLGAYPSGDRGMLQKIALSMIGAGDPRLAASLMQQPSREQEAWQEQIGPAQFAAGQERLSNVNMRQIADMMMSGQREDIRLGQAGERLEISRAAQKLNEWKAEHPNMQLKTRADGMIVGINPADPTKVVESGVQSGDLSDQEKEEARIEAATVAEKGRVSRATTATGQRKAAATLREERIRERPSKPGTVSPSQARVAEESRAQRIMDENPDLKDIYEFTDQGVSIKTAKELAKFNWPGGRSGEDLLAEAELLHKKATRLLRGGILSNGIKGKKDTGTIRVQSPDGAIGSIPASQLNEALKQGYTKVE